MRMALVHDKSVKRRHCVLLKVKKTRIGHGTEPCGIGSSGRFLYTKELMGI